VQFFEINNDSPVADKYLSDDLYGKPTARDPIND